MTSALKRARVTMRNGLPRQAEPPLTPGSASEKQLIDRLTRAYEAGDVDGEDAQELAVSPVRTIRSRSRPPAHRYR